MDRRRSSDRGRKADVHAPVHARASHGRQSGALRRRSTSAVCNSKLYSVTVSPWASFRKLLQSAGLALELGCRSRRFCCRAATLRAQSQPSLFRRARNMPPGHRLSEPGERPARSSSPTPGEHTNGSAQPDEGSRTGSQRAVLVLLAVGTTKSLLARAAATHQLPGTTTLAIPGIAFAILAVVVRLPVVRDRGGPNLAHGAAGSDANGWRPRASVHSLTRSLPLATLAAASALVAARAPSVLPVGVLDLLLVRRSRRRGADGLRHSRHRSPCCSARHSICAACPMR